MRNLTRGISVAALSAFLLVMGAVSAFAQTVETNLDGTVDYQGTTDSFLQYGIGEATPLVLQVVAGLFGLSILFAVIGLVWRRVRGMARRGV